jgi:5'-3' exonuclease
VDKVLFIDGANAMWRACVSFGPPMQHLQSSNGACQCKSPWDTENQFCYGERYVYVYNFFRNLRPLIEQFQPDKCFFVLEGHPQFRYNLFGDYKANRIIKQASRQEANDKFLNAKDIIVPLMQHLPITTCRAANYEADDTIGTLVDNMKDEDLTIITNDSDYIQLLQRGYSNVSIYNPIKKSFMEAPVYPYVPWKCLAGDKSDNIPALLKPKKALLTVSDPQLFNKFMSVPENFSNFQVNRQLIEFRPVPEEEIFIKEGARNFTFLKQAFELMKFVSMTNTQSWDKFCLTFNCIKY